MYRILLESENVHVVARRQLEITDREDTARVDDFSHVKGLGFEIRRNGNCSVSV
jgi:hypothetical protein